MLHLASRSTLKLSTFLLLCMMFISASVSFAQSSPEDVVTALIATENAGDVEGAVALFAEDAVVTLPTGVLDTPEAILIWQQDLVAGHFRLEALNIEADGSNVSWTGAVSLDRFRGLGIASMDATWSLVIEDGLIQTFDFAFTPEAFVELQAGSVAAGLIATENAGDVEGAVALFAEDAVVTLPTGVLDTPEAILGWQQDLAAGHFHLEPEGRSVDGNTVSWTGEISLDRFREMGFASLDADWVIVVEDGLIQTFDFAFTPKSLESLQAAQPS